MEIKKKLISEKEFSLSYSLQVFRELEIKLKKSKIKVDDYLLHLFEGDNKKIVKSYNNRNLLITLLLAFIWSRLHRDVFWDSKGEVWLAKKNQVLKLKNLVKRLESRIGQEQKPMLLACYILIYSCYRDYYKVNELCEELRVLGYPKNAYLSNYFIGANSFNYGLISQKNPHQYFDFDEDFAQLGICRERELTILVSCDEHYYNKFSSDFIFSASNSLTINHNIIFIVVDSDLMKVEDNIYTVGMRFPALKSSAALYASIRFVVAKSILSIIESPLLILDIDFEFNVEVNSYLTLLRESSFDIGLCFNKKYRAMVPWSANPAAVVYFNNCKESAVFLDFFMNNFEISWKNNDSNWWIDQNCLFSSYEKMRLTRPGTIFKNITYIRDSGITNADPEVKNFKNKLGSR